MNDECLNQDAALYTAKNLGGEYEDILTMIEQGLGDEFVAEYRHHQISELERIRDRAQSKMKAAYVYAYDEWATDEDRLGFRQAEAAYNVAYMNWESAKIFERLKEKGRDNHAK